MRRVQKTLESYLSGGRTESGVSAVIAQSICVTESTDVGSYHDLMSLIIEDGNIEMR